MVNVLADYTDKNGNWGYNEYQIAGTDDQYLARDYLCTFLAHHGFTAKMITVVHGEYTLAELEAIHADRTKARGTVMEIFVFDLEKEA